MMEVRREGKKNLIWTGRDEEVGVDSVSTGEKRPIQNSG